jgi:hypothetical protein
MKTFELRPSGFFSNDPKQPKITTNIKVIELQPVVEMLKRAIEDPYEALFAPSEIIDFINSYGD